jgi:hypothetical protein
LFPQPSLGGKEWLILVDIGKRGSRLDIYSCCNPNLGFMTKAKACKGVGQELAWESHFISWECKRVGGNEPPHSQKSSQLESEWTPEIL